MKFIVDKSYWNLFPDSKLGVLLLKNMQNGESTDEIKSILKEANNEAKKYLTKEILSENPIIAVWREAYKKFKTKKGDDKGAICRCFNWRDGARTMIKDETKNSFLIMELLDNRLEELNLALDYISDNAKKYLNADIEKYILDINNPEITLK